MASPPWSNLPEELLQLIFERLTMDYVDLLLCREVCVSWRSIVIQVCRKLKPLIHPLLLITRSNGEDEEGGCYVLNTKTNRVLNISSSDTRGRWYRGSSYGWLLTIGCKFPHEIHLLNPFTRAQIRLPPAGSDLLQPQWLKVITSTSPSNPNCIVLVSHSFNEKFAICKPGDQRWMNITRLFPLLWIRSLRFDNIFYKGQFYIVNFKGDIVRCKGDSEGNQFPRAPGLQLSRAKCTHHNYLVESTTGDLLLVTRYVRCEQRMRHKNIFDWKTVDFKVNKLDWSKKEWSGVINLGDEVIFLSKRSSISVSADSRSGEYIANCIYFVDDVEEEYTNKYGCSDTGVFNMGTKCVERLYQSSRIWNTTLNWMRPDI